MTLGRATEPSAEEVLASEAELATKGLSGWLAIMRGNPYEGSTPRLMEVRPMGSPTKPFEEAADACIRALLESRSIQP